MSTERFSSKRITRSGGLAWIAALLLSFASVNSYAISVTAFGQSDIYVGETTNYFITVGPAGALPETATLSYALPSGAQYNSSSTSQGTCNFDPAGGTGAGALGCNIGLIPAGQSVSINVTVQLNTIGDNTNAFNVAASFLFVTGSGTILVPDPGSASTVTRVHDFPVVSLVTSSGDAGEPNTNGEFTLTVNEPVLPGYDNTFLVGLNILPSSTATAGVDFAAPQKIIPIPYRQTTVLIPVNVIDDTLVEGSETVSAQLVTVQSGIQYHLGKNSSASLKILDNDLPPPTVSLTVADGDAGEPNNVGVFAVTLDQPAGPGDVTVSYTVSGSAAANKDYAALSGSVVIPAGKTGASVTVTPIDDQIYNGPTPRVVTITLANGSGYSVGKTNADSITIKDNELPPLPTATLAVTDGDIGEPNNNGTLTVNIDQVAPANGLVLQYVVSGSAVAGKDYSTLSGQISIPAGGRSGTITIAPIDDQIYNGPNPRVVSVTLGSSTGYNVGAANNGSITIKDNETPPLPVATLAIADGDVGEPSNNGTLTVNLDQPAPAGGLVVRYNVSGTAVAGKDYSTLSGQITVPANSRSANITIAPIDDSIYNGPNPRTVTVTLVDIANARTYNLGKPADASVTIKDNETPPLPIATLVVNDGDAGEPNNAGQFQIKLNAAPGGNGLTVNYSVSGSAVAGKDYQSLSGTVSFGPQATSANIDINPIDDQIYNGTNPRIVAVALASGAGYNLGTANNGSITIKDNETPPLPVVTLAIADGDVGEPGNNGTLTVNIDQPAPAGGLVVRYNVSGAAVAGKDYSTLPGQITIPANGRSANIDIAPIDDLIYNGPTPRTVTVTLIDIATARTYNLGKPADASVTIKDNETPPLPIATLVVNDGDAGEPNNAGQFQIKLNAAPGGNGLTVNYSVSGSAVAGKDYQSLSGTVSFGPQATSANIDINPIDDQIYNGTNPRIVAVALASGAGYNLGTANNGSITIKDNETPPLPVATLAVTDGIVGEPNNNATLTVNLDQPAPANGLVVRYVVSGTAVAGKDYAALSGQVTVPANSRSADIAITPIDDLIYNGTAPRSVTVALVDITSARVYSVGKPSDATVTISDNEAPPVPVATLVVSDVDAGEPNNPGQFQIKLDSAPGGNGLTVNYNISGSAVAGKDYQTLSGSVTFAPQATSANINVAVIDDQIYNGPTPRVVSVALGNGTGYNTGTANNGSITIKDNETPPLPVATLSITDGIVGEPNNNATLTVNLDQPAPANGLVVRYVVTGSAVANKDYTALSGQVTVPANSRRADITIAPIDDSIYNGAAPRSVTVALIDIASARSYSVGKPSDATVTISDNEAPPLPVATLVVNDGDAGEPNNPGQFQIKLDTAAGGNGITVTYNVSGSAVADKDYKQLTGSVFFGPQVISANIDVAIIDDLIYNGVNPRNVTVTLASGTGYNVGSANNGSITIKDNETPPLPVATLVVSDGDAGEPSNAGRFQIKLDTAPGGNGLTINYTVGGSAVAGKDYQSLNGVVTFGPQATSANIDVTPIDDQIYNATNPRTVVATISSGNGYNVGNATNGTITIKDNEAPPLPVATLVVSDGDAGEPSNAGQFQIKLDAAPGGSGLTINYTVTGNAVAGKDYQSLTGTAVFGPQATTANVDIAVIDDQIYNGPNPRNVVMTLAGGAGYNIGNANSSSLAIKDNEAPPLPIATLSVSDADAGEPDNAGEFTVTLNQPAGANGLTVGYAIEGTAVANQDYQALSGTVQIAANTSAATIAVTPINDQIYNGTTPRTVHVRLIVLSDIETTPLYSVGEQNSDTITIKDDEVAPLSLVVNVQTVDPNATTGGSSGAFAIILNQPAPTNGLTVNYTVSGSAQADQDYIALKGAAVIAAGTTQAVVLVTPIANAATQGSKTVELSLAPGENYQVANEVPARITISRDVLNSDSNNAPGAPATGSNPLTIERVVGELQQTSRVGADVPFTVRVIDSSGNALSGVTIDWSLDANGVSAGGTILNATAITDSNGAASATLRTGPMAANYAFTARASTTINNQAASVSETFVVIAGLVKIVSPNTPESAIAQAFDQLCPTLNSNTNRTASQQQLLDRCTALYGALANSSDAEVLQALRALAPEELSAQGTLAHEVMRTQIDNIAERLRALRRGSKQLSLGSLSLNIDDQNVPGSVLDAITQQAIGAAAGNEGQDSIWRDERLGVFVSGEINHGKRSQTERESDFSFDTRGITFGVDYRISDAVVVGGALGYAGTDVTLGSSGGNLDAKGQILSLYGSWQWDAWWSLDGVLSYGTQNFSTQRVIDYTIDGTRTLLYADGDNSSANVALSASLNYALTAQNGDVETPSGISSELFARLDHTRSHINGYTESGADELNLQIDEQQVQTWHLAFGVDWSKAISRSWGVITPQASVSWEYDGSDAYNINGYFVSDPNATMWSLTTDTPDRSYFRANAGVSALYANGWSWFAQYETQLQRDNFSNHGWHGGLRYSRRF